MRWFPAVKKDSHSNNWPLSLLDWNDFDLFANRTTSLFSSDIKETDKEYELSVDLPGYDKDKIELDYHNDTLTIQASRDEEKHEEDDKGTYIRRERVSGSCVRQFHLPHVNEEAIEASFDKGVLKVKLPKTAEQEDPRRRIQIK